MPKFFLKGNIRGDTDNESFLLNEGRKEDCFLCYTFIIQKPT